MAMMPAMPARPTMPATVQTLATTSSISALRHPGLRPADELPHPREHGRGRERFRHVLVRAGRQTARAVGVLALGGEQDDVHARRLRVGLDLLADLESV